MSDTKERFFPRKDGMLKGRLLEFFHHSTLQEWGTPPREDSFAVLHPVKKKRKAPLYVVLHSAGHDLYSCLGCTLYKGNHDIYHTPEDFFGLYLDCRTHEKEDFWWGGRRPDDLEAFPERKDHIQGVEKRIIATVKWAIKHYKLDPERVYLCGNSMGGSGALGIGMANGDLFAAVKVNVPAGVEHMLDRCTALESQKPDPPLCIDYSAQDDSWSKGHEKFYKFMREKRFALYGYWADFGHANNNETMLAKNDLIHSFPWLTIKRNEAYPVFTNCSSDTPNPWENDPEKVPASGQINGFLRWAKGKDTKEEFTMKIFLLSPMELLTAFPMPEQVSTDISFRRLQHFKISPGEKIAWQFGTRKGIAEADSRGLLTLQDLKILWKGKLLKLRKVK